jgi:hypothetical protein
MSEPIQPDDNAELNLRAIAAQRLINAYHRTFNTPEGKLVLEDLEAKFGMSQPAFLPLDKGTQGLSYDPIHAAIRDGQRSIKLHIQKALSLPIASEGDGKKRKARVKKDEE